jgi:general L-amino acid transport system substrate-binding protein
VVHCGAEERAGFAVTAEDDRTGGLAVDLCRALAVAVLGPQAKVAFRIYDTATDTASVTRGEDEVAFLSADTIAANHLAGGLVPGPAVFFDQIGLMVPRADPAQGVADLSGAVVCLMIGSPAQRALQDAMSRQHVAFAPLAFEEEVEMLDAYDVGRCRAMTSDVTALAGYRRSPGVNRLASRILPQPLAITPLLAVTGTADAAWSSLVFWVMQGLILADRPASAWQGPGAGALPFTAAELGLRPDWLTEVRSTVGLYDTMLARNLPLPPGPNASWPSGLLIPPAAN